MRVCIHRGTHEIGGTCVEIESQGKQIVLDIGLPLDSDIQDVPLPPVKGFDRPDESLLGVVISHPHQDHYGLAGKLPTGTPLLIGSGAERILEAASVFVPGKVRFDNVIHLQDRMPIALGPFIVTPFLMDHSAYDAYAILVEADGKRLFYSGDLRAHGRKAKLFERLLAHPPEKVDVLLLEGTTVGRTGLDNEYPTEADLEKRFEQSFRETAGLSLVWCSGQNIDRLVTIYRAARHVRRQFIVDMYTASVLRAIGNPYELYPREACLTQGMHDPLGHYNRSNLAQFRSRVLPLAGTAGESARKRLRPRWPLRCWKAEQTPAESPSPPPHNILRPARACYQQGPAGAPSCVTSIS